MSMPSKADVRIHPWVLVAEADVGLSRGAVVAVRSLSRLGYRPAVAEVDGLSLAGASRYCAARVPVCSARLYPDAWARSLHEELARRPYLGVLPVNDMGLVALGAPGARFADKSRWAVLANAAGFPLPPTTVYASTEELVIAAEAQAYPIVVKPAVKRWPARRVDSASELASVPSDGAVLVQPWLQDDLHGVVGIVQRGRVVQAVHFRYLSIWPVRCGTAASGVTTEPDFGLEARLAALLSGYDGLFHVDMAGERLLDINVRLHPSLALAMGAGVDLIDAWCTLQLHQDIPQARGRAGVRYRWLEGDLKATVWSLWHHELSLAQGARHLMPRAGMVHTYESLTDPGPLAARLRLLARKAVGSTPT